MKSNNSSTMMVYFISMIFLLAGTACSPSVEPIRFGHDNCGYCRMQISHKTFGAEIITKEGHVIKFDAVECMAAFILQSASDTTLIHSLWVIDYTRPGTFINAHQAIYLHSPTLRSPMGLNLSAFEVSQDVESIRERHTGHVLFWDDVLFMVNRMWNQKE